MFTIGSTIKIGTVDYVIIAVSKVTENEKFLTQDGVTHMLAIQDNHGDTYTVKAFNKGGFSNPKRMKL